MNQGLSKIISGGQTGVDRAALDISIESGIPHGGWCPRGRKAEDGIIDKCYQLKETDSFDYAHRTKLNVRDSDGTLILKIGELDGGTALTSYYANQQKKPILIIDLEENNDIGIFNDWLNNYAIKVLNIAGPRESKRIGIYSQALLFLRRVL